MRSTTTIAFTLNKSDAAKLKTIAWRDKQLVGTFVRQLVEKLIQNEGIEDDISTELLIDRMAYAFKLDERLITYLKTGK